MIPVASVSVLHPRVVLKDNCNINYNRGCSQPFIFSYFYSIGERVDRLSQRKTRDLTEDFLILRLARFARLPSATSSNFALALTLRLRFLLRALKNKEDVDSVVTKSFLCRVQVTKSLFDMGCYEVSLGDTIGVGAPG